MIGDRLKMLRHEKELAMRDMAEMFQLSISAWNKYEKNESEPNISNMIKMADFFGVSLDFLLGRTNIRDSNLIRKAHTTNELIDKFEEISIGDPSKMYFIIENLTASLEAYKSGKASEKSLQLLLEALSILIAYFNDLSEMRLSNACPFSEALNYHNRSSSNLITNINNILYNIYQTDSN
jgi:transcriptional regulator with XRE-family HTH domain